MPQSLPDPLPTTGPITGTNGTAGVTPYGFFQATDEARSLFYDPFDGAVIDTTHRWNAAVVSGTGAAVTQANGTLTVTAGALINSYAYVNSRPTFNSIIPGFLQPSFLIQLESGTAAALTTLAHRFWGIGTSIAAPTSANPITDGAGFEIGTDGKMYAVVYSAGVRGTLGTGLFDLSSTGNSKMPSDGAAHRYLIHYRTDRIYFYIDGVLAATATVSPEVQTLPVRHSQVNSMAIIGTMTYKVLGSVVADTAKNSAGVSDGIYQWRKATVKPASTAPVATDTALVVGHHPSSPLPAGTNILGKVSNDIVVSTANASTANLTAGATFTGTAELTTKAYAIQVTIRADQALTVIVDQSQEGTNWDQTDSWTVAASATDSTAGRTVQAVGAYFRLRVTNNGASTTTFFRLQSVLCGFGETLPRALTQLGNLKVSLMEPSVGSRADGYLNVRYEPTSILLDTFESVDTTNTWTLGGLTVPTGANGVLTVSPTTAANGSSWAKSQATFVESALAYLQNEFIITLEAGVVTGNTRWWGLAIPQTTPTTGVPVTNGVVFEVRAADGLLYGSVYSATALSQSVALTRPSDGTAHRYQILYRGSRAYFSIDGAESGSVAFPISAVSALPTTIGSVNGASTVTTVLTSTMIGLADTGRNGQSVADPKFPWRESRVTAAGELLTTDTYRQKLSVAVAHSGRLTVGAAADAATAGRLWLINPVGSAILIELRRIEMSSAPIAATAFITSPRITVERVTFTGTASGASITPAQRDSTEPALVGTVRTASTGLTLTGGAVAYGFMVAPILTAVGAAVPVMQEWEPAEPGRLVLRAGQGVVVRQADAGTTSDTRAFQINLAWAEFTNPA